MNDTKSASAVVSSGATKELRMATMPLRRGHYKILATGSMEQIIGAALSALVGIVIPLIQLVRHPELSSLVQGVLGSAGLTGIAVGSVVLGKLSDRYGYLFYFRLCPVLIMLGSLLAFFFPHIGALTVGLMIAGIGVGGGYSLDEAYISELMPRRWRLFMVGIAKSTSSLGFIAISGFSYLIIRCGLRAEHWPYLLLMLTALGLITLLTRLHFRNSPRWLLAKGERTQAEEAAKFFLGNDVVVDAPEKASVPEKFSDAPMWKKIVFSGLPWACEGVGVYGVGVFLPLLVLALGLDRSEATGMAAVGNSVMLTTVINCFILVGFIIGLLIVRRTYHVAMLQNGFFGAALGLLLLLGAYCWHWGLMPSIAGFVIFEMSLNAGPHLITFIIPSQIYDVKERALGTGLAAMLGKLGAIAGVFLMPMLLKAGGIMLVLTVCIAVNLLGALITAIFGRTVLPRRAGA